MSAKKKPSTKKAEKPTNLDFKANLFDIVQINVSASTSDSELLKGVKDLVNVGKDSLKELNEHWDELSKLWKDAKKESEAQKKDDEKDEKQDKPIDLGSLFNIKDPFTSLAEAFGFKPHSCCQDHEEQTGAKEAKGTTQDDPIQYAPLGEKKSDDKPEKPKSNLTAAEFENALKKGVSAASPKPEDLNKATWPGKENTPMASTLADLNKIVFGKNVPESEFIDLTKPKPEDDDLRV